MARALVPVEQVRELRAAAMGFRLLESKAKQRIAKSMRATYLPMLGREVERRAAMFGVDTGMDIAAFGDQRFYTGNNPGIAIGTGRRTLGGGARTDEIVRGAEFGANRTLWTETKARDRNGKPILRRATRQFPSQKPKGYVVYPTLADVMPKVAAAWIGGVADEIRAAMGA